MQAVVARQMDHVPQLQVDLELIIHPIQGAVSRGVQAEAVAAEEPLVMLVVVVEVVSALDAVLIT